MIALLALSTVSGSRAGKGLRCPRPKSAARLEKLEADNIQLREENAALRLENTRLRVENQLLRDEIARLKNLPPRQPFRSSGMDKATDAAPGGRLESKKKPRGPKLDVKRVSRQEVLRIDAPAGSRFKGYRSVYVRDLVLKAELVQYRRECWVTPDRKTVLAPLPAGIIGGYGVNLRRLCLMLHTQSQVTTGRLTTLLNDIGLDTSKRQMVRLLTRRLDGFVAEDTVVLHAGLVSSKYLTVDDTGARHSHNPYYTSHIRFPHLKIEVTAEFPLLAAWQLSGLRTQRRGIRLPERAPWRSGHDCRTSDF